MVIVIYNVSWLHWHGIELTMTETLAAELAQLGCHPIRGL